MDWIFTPQDLFGDLTSAVESGVSTVEGGASSVVSTVESGLGAASNDVQNTVQQVAQGGQNLLTAGENVVSAGAGAVSGGAQQVQNLLTSAPAIVTATISNEVSTATTAAATLRTQANQEASSLLSSGSTLLSATVSPTLNAAATLLKAAPGAASGGVSQVENLLGSAASSLKNAVTLGATSQLTPVASLLGGAGKTAEAVVTTIAASATNELLESAKIGAAAEAAVPVFQTIYNAGAETTNVAKNILMGNPAFQGVTTGTVISAGTVNNNPVVTALQGVSTAANALPGVNSKLFETIAGPNANPVALAGAQILDFTLQHPLETALIVGATIVTAGGAAPEEAALLGGEDVTETTVADSVINSASDTGVTTDVSDISAGGDISSSPPMAEEIPSPESTVSDDVNSPQEGDNTGC